MHPILVTLLVLKLEIFNSFKEEQKKNSQNKKSGKSVAMEDLNRSSALGEKENKNELQYYKQSKQIIDIILDYIQNECEENIELHIKEKVDAICKIDEILIMNLEEYFNSKN